MNDYPLLPIDVITEEILKDNTPCEILELATLSKETFNSIKNSPTILRNLSLKYNLPFTNSVVDLCNFSKMSKTDLLHKAIRIDDLRVVMGLMGSVEVDGYILEYALSEKQDRIALAIYDRNKEHEDPEDFFRGAAHMGRVEVLKELIGRGYNFFNRGLSNGVGYPEVVKLMLEHGANNYSEALKSAASYGNVETITLIYEAGSKVLTRRDLDRAAKEAALKRRGENLQVLIELGANRKIRIKSYKEIYDRRRDNDRYRGDRRYYSNRHRYSDRDSDDYSDSDDDHR